MNELKGKTAIVTGGGTGIGRATVAALAAQGAKVFAVARDGARLEAMRREVGGDVHALAGDATDPRLAARVIRELRPDLIVLSGGVRPQMGSIDQQTWDSFSEAWTTDVKAAFHFCQEALAAPLAPGSTVVLLSSGAAIAGSPKSGGYAGAKRMMWLMAGYLQKVSDERQLGIRFRALVPKQLIAGTTIQQVALSVYSADTGVTPERYMERFGAPLGPEGVADAILRIARGETGDATALGVSSKEGLHTV